MAVLLIYIISGDQKERNVATALRWGRNLLPTIYLIFYNGEILKSLSLFYLSNPFRHEYFELS